MWYCSHWRTSILYLCIVLIAYINQSVMTLHLADQIKVIDDSDDVCLSHRSLVCNEQCSWAWNRHGLYYQIVLIRTCLISAHGKHITTVMVESVIMYMLFSSCINSSFHFIFLIGEALIQKFKPLHTNELTYISARDFFL